jgi:hypothetical protein
MHLVKRSSLQSFSCLVAAMVFVVYFAKPSAAQTGVGVRAGISATPGQFYFGGHATVGPVVDKLWFRPNVEVGVGNNVTLLAFNGEFAYFVPLRENPWNVYLGGGPAANIITTGPPGDRSTGVRPGFNFLAGLAQHKGFFTEIKFGALDSPSFKFGIGYTFR